MNQTIYNGGLGFLSVLTLMFVAAKLLGVIAWSWFLVFLPALLFPLLVAGLLVMMLVVFIGAFILDTINNIKRRNRA